MASYSREFKEKMVTYSDIRPYKTGDGSFGSS